MIELTGASLSLQEFAAVAAGGEHVVLTGASRERVAAARAVIERSVASGEAVYGVNTGFGNLANVRIADADLETLQERLVLSHAAGWGSHSRTPLCAACCCCARTRWPRGTRVCGRCSSTSCSRCSITTCSPRCRAAARSARAATSRRWPIWRCRFSVAAACAGPGSLVPAAEALRDAGLAPVRLAPREGLGLVNGTQAMTSLLALAVLEARRLVRVADLVGALSTDALRGTDAAFDARIHAVRPHPGQLASARNLWGAAAGLRHPRFAPQRTTCGCRIPTPCAACRRCTARCATRWRDVERRLVIEMNSATDNPLVFAADDEALSGGNFHGEPMALAADFLAIALAELGSISERRTEKLTNDTFSRLPPFLVANAGLNSGFMMAQVTAAALVSENKVLAHPASVDSIPTSADKEDHVSMGMWAALKCRQVVANVRQILAIELPGCGPGHRPPAAAAFERPARSGASLGAGIRRGLGRGSRDGA